jgi:hypothetical protein
MRKGLSARVKEKNTQKYGWYLPLDRKACQEEIVIRRSATMFVVTRIGIVRGQIGVIGGIYESGANLV